MCVAPAYNSLGRTVHRQFTRVDRTLHAPPTGQSFGQKRTGGGVTIYTNTLWSNKSEVMYAHSLNGIDLRVTQCHPRFIRHESVITAKYLMPLLARKTTSQLFQALIVPLLEDNLRITESGFTRASTLPLTVFLI